MGIVLDDADLPHTLKPTDGETPGTAKAPGRPSRGFPSCDLDPVDDPPHPVDAHDGALRDLLEEITWRPAAQNQHAGSEGAAYFAQLCAVRVLTQNRLGSARCVVQRYRCVVPPFGSVHHSSPESGAIHGESEPPGAAAARWVRPA